MLWIVRLVLLVMVVLTGVFALGIIPIWAQGIAQALFGCFLFLLVVAFLGPKYHVL
jgi:uncharacterized membrane protein YtjA (UPF0391 family)